MKEKGQERARRAFWQARLDEARRQYAEKRERMDRREDWKALGLYALRLLFTTENPKEVDRVLRSWETAAPFEPGGCTRGLYLRGVE